LSIINFLTMIRTNIFILLIFTVFGGYAQLNSKLYLPLEFQKAYEKSTRSADGKPGINYWQNHSDYIIKAKIDPVKKTLAGEEEVTYHNDSKDTLKFIPLFLYHDVYSRKAARDSEINPDLLTDGVVISKVEVNHVALDLKDEEKFSRSGTQMMIIPDHPVEPDSSITLTITWNYIIPGKGFDRSGAYDSTSMFIAYWYPEIAVYDDIDGWDFNDFTGGVEFYHDYSNYTVEIEAPANFLLWASVAPLNAEDIYPDFIKKRLNEVNEKGATAIVTKKDIEKGFSVKSTTWKYKAGNFDDFCFGISDHYQWDARLFKNGDSYFLNTVYPSYHDKFSVVSQIETEAVGVFTREMPAYPFPFRYFTAFNGLEGGGMEFPGMINDAFADTTEYRRPVTNYEANHSLTFHEMFHMYFPFYMGINEKKFSWMDEGWASYTDFFSTKNHRSYGMSWLGRLSVPPMMVPSYITPRNFYANAYTIGSYSYYSLQQMLGDEVFLKCLHEYIMRWNHKHPSPYDFFNTFNSASGQDLSWFWKKWYFDWGYMDLGIRGLNGKSLEIVNAGGKPVAASVILSYFDQSSEEIKVNPGVWKSGDSYLIPVAKKKKLIKAELVIPASGDAVRSNNTWMNK
jgi:hypothetical protein